MSDWTEFEDLCAILNPETAKFRVIDLFDLRAFTMACFNAEWNPQIKESCIMLQDVSGSHAMGFLELKNLLAAGEKVYEKETFW